MRCHTPEDSDVLKVYTSSVWSSTIIRLHEKTVGRLMRKDHHEATTTPHF